MWPRDAYLIGAAALAAGVLAAASVGPGKTPASAAPAPAGPRAWLAAAGVALLVGLYGSEVWFHAGVLGLATADDDKNGHYTVFDFAGLLLQTWALPLGAVLLLVGTGGAYRALAPLPRK